MKRVSLAMLMTLAGTLGASAQLTPNNPDYPMYHKTVTQDQSFTMCPSGTASIMTTLNTGKPMFIMVTGTS